MTTPLAALIQALRSAADHDPRVEAPSEAVLWCDPNREFVPLLPALRRAMPNLLTLGDYDPPRRQGPAIWLRAALGRAVPGITWDDDAPAVLYLPGIARETLRAAEDCPKPLQLLAWLVVGGAVFGHANSKDWTLRGFLSSKPAYRGLGLDVAQDEATREVLATAAPKLFEMPLAELQGCHVDAPWLLTLLVPDLEEDTLAWIGGRLAPETDPTRFAAFQARAKSELKIDPATITPAAAAARVLRREKGWSGVWERFAKGGRGFHEDAAVFLAKVDPPDLLSADPAVYATVNVRREADLRIALAKLKDADEQRARDAVARLAADHWERCEGPWAARGEARLAEAVQHLAHLATILPLPTQDAEGLAEAYAATGWEADDAVLRDSKLSPRGKTPAPSQPCRKTETRWWRRYAPSTPRGSNARRWLYRRCCPPVCRHHKSRMRPTRSCSSTGCAWMSRNASWPCSGGKGPWSTWAGAGPVFRA
jgi:hypothetical protein